MTSRIICVVNDTAETGSKLDAEHGLSFWIETEQGHALLDTGQTAAVLSHNLSTLGLSPQDLDAVVLSHAHYDHTGGLEVVLSANTDLTLYAHPDIFRPRYSLRQGNHRSIGMAYSEVSLSGRVKLHLSEDPVEILPKLWTTGGITERPEPVGSSPNLFIHNGLDWRPDPYLDDMSVVLETAQGIIVICGCCHAGILNTLFHVERNFSTPLLAVLGGLHLLYAEDQYLEHVVRVLNERFPRASLYINHCTGENAFNYLTRTCGDRVKTCPAGTLVTLDDGGRGS